MFFTSAFSTRVFGRIGVGLAAVFAVVFISGTSAAAQAGGTSTASGTVWVDADSDGVIDPGESTLSGVRVNLRQGGAVIAWTLTEANGSFDFANIAAGNWGVQVVTSTLPPGATSTYDLTAPADGRSIARLVAGETESDHNFGFFLATGDIAGRLWDDVDGDGVQAARDVGFVRELVKLRQGGVVVATTFTNFAGDYVFSDIPAGAYRVQAPSSLPNSYLALNDTDGGGDHRVLVSVVGGTVARADFTYQQRFSTISGQVWIDSDSDGQRDAIEGGAGRQLVYLRQGGVVIAQTNVAPDGSYSFGVRPPGAYAVQVKPTMDLTQTFDPQGAVDSRAGFTLSAGETEFIEFGYVSSVADLGGVVWRDADGDGVRDAGEAGIGGVSIQLRQGGVLLDTRVTDSFGAYRFDDVAQGSYALVVVPSSVTGTPTADPQGAVDGRANRQALGLPAELQLDFGYL